MYDEKREMHKVTCAKCNKETEVPFKPDGSRPVYCRECFQKNKPKRY
jgi:CxxC-x17-CxxC domain-containing protein